MSETRKNFEKYSWQRKEDGKFVNPQITGRLPEKDVNKYVGDSTKAFNQSE